MSNQTWDQIFQFELNSSTVIKLGQLILFMPNILRDRLLLSVLIAQFKIENEKFFAKVKLILFLLTHIGRKM